MTQIDIYGQVKPAPEFRDIRNQRPSTAEEKAQLLLILGRLINKCPGSVVNGSVQRTRAWVEARKSAAKVAKSPRSSIQQISSAINSLEGFA